MPFLTPQQQKAEMAHLAQGRIPFYYSEEDLAKGRAAESIPLGHLKALAEAHQVGLARNVLRPDVGEYVLANALRENRDDFGVDAATAEELAARKNPAYLGLLEGDLEDGPRKAARQAIGVLASKQRPDRSAEEVIRRWNGGGPLSYRHQRLVRDMHKMLQHPANSRVVEMYNSFLNPQRSASAE